MRPVLGIGDRIAGSFGAGGPGRPPEECGHLVLLDGIAQRTRRNGVGVATFLGGHASLSGNTIVNNGIGVYSPNSGTSTYQNNQVRENPSGDTGGTINPRTFK